MRPRHTQHVLTNFPVNVAVFLGPDRLVVGGGGGSTRTGVKNKLILYSIDSHQSISKKSEFEIEDTPTSIAVDTQSNSIICGINSSRDEILKGDNENCRLFAINDDIFHLNMCQGTLPPDEDDYQKITVLSPDRKLLAVSGCHDLSVLSYPNLAPAAKSIHSEKEIYDVTFSSTSQTLVVATTHNLLVYSIEPRSSMPSRDKGKEKESLKETSLNLQLVHTVDLPADISASGTCSFRSVRYHPKDDAIIYTVINITPPRTRGRKTPPRQGYVCRWHTKTWTVEKQRKVGDKALTSFDISAEGRFLGYGSSDLSIGMLDSKTLTPVVQILKAHEFPSTFVKFDPTTRLFASGSPDNSLRIVAIPDVIGGSSWSVIILILLTIIAVLFAVAVQKYIATGTISW